MTNNKCLFALFCFFTIVCLTKSQTGKVLPYNVQKCDKSVVLVTKSVVKYINELPCVFAVLKESDMATNEIICTQDLKKPALGLFVPKRNKFLIYLKLNNSNSFNLTHNVILHELGHALGLSHNRNQKSVMYSEASSSKIRGFDVLDIASLQTFHRVHKGSTCWATRQQQEIFESLIFP